MTVTGNRNHAVGLKFDPKVAVAKITIDFGKLDVDFAELSELLASIFEERAEFLSKVELDKWTAETPRDQTILAKLEGPGSKLLIGPRGSGKSTMLKRAYYRLAEGHEVLPAYVNYARSLALEPLFHHNANALQLFRQWVLFKVVRGVDEGMREAGISVNKIPPSLIELSKISDTFIPGLETGAGSSPPDVMIAPSQLLSLLEVWTRELGFRRCVLLLDDAAHAFSAEQQREFFEIFRELRSRIVAAKAAVYPGITSYSPYFQVGHEGELVEAWMSPDDAGYLGTMREIAQRRLTPTMLKRLEGRTELVEYLALASFGIPRGFLNMLSEVLGVDEGQGLNPTRQRAAIAIGHHADSVIEIFQALGGKLPRFKHFIEVGRELISAASRGLQHYNSLRPIRGKAVVLAFAEPIEPELQRILSFLEYAGIVRRTTGVSRGVKGTFQRYIVHYAIILNDNALSLGRTFSVADVIRALSVRDAHAFVRTRGISILGADFRKRCTLDLEPCQNCGTPRSSEDAHFCVRCGAPLKDASVYEELLKTPIGRLPMTKNKIAGLLKHSSIRTVQDVLLDHEVKELRAVPYIGPKWAERIRRLADEYVSV